jgi:zinc protease
MRRELRDALGLAYDLDCSYSPSRAYPQASLISSGFYTDPARTGAAVTAVQRLVESFVEDGPAEAEMKAARAFFADLASRAERSQRFWARTLSELRFRGVDPADLVNLTARWRKQTGEMLQRAVSDSVVPDRRLTVVCRPSK